VNAPRYGCGSKRGRHYQTIRAVIDKAAGQLAEKKRFAIKSLVPNVFYMQETQNFGILPHPLMPDYRIDVHATDQAYFRSSRAFGSSASR
jgi:hypothetical protein